MGKRRLSAGAGALLGAVVAATAAFGAGPDPGVSKTGSTLAKVQYVASQGGATTVVRAINVSGRVLRSVRVRGDMGFPMVAFDGTVEGLSADGRTLVVASQRNTLYRKSSSFAVLTVPNLRVRRLIRLPGDFSYDALSSSGQTLYLVEHMSANDMLRYRVRAYDLRAGRLLEKMVTDKRRWQSVMTGVPMSRAWSLDKRWAFTLYGGGTTPFVHSLDTRNEYAVCIDLPQRFASIELAKLKLEMQSGNRLLVKHRVSGKTLAVLDTKNFRVVDTVR
jgi:hypothetical protein